MICALWVHFLFGVCGGRLTFSCVVYREAVKLSGDKVLGLVFSRFGLRLSRFAAFFVAMVMVSGTLMWAGPQVASAREAQQLSTCLNLATESS